MLTEEAIVEQIQVDPEMMTVLAIIRDLNLADAWLWRARCAISSGTSSLENQGLMRRQIWIWSFMTLRSAMRRLQQIEQELKKTYPKYAWEVKNQVYMHQHSPGTAPYHSACDAVSKYPEAVYGSAVRLRKEGSARALSPLWDKGYRRLHRSADSAFLANPERLTVYTERMKKKNWQSKWPPLEVRFPK